MSPEEIYSILKSAYGTDLGYDTDDSDYEYFSNLKAKGKYR